MYLTQFLYRSIPAYGVLLSSLLWSPVHAQEQSLTRDEAVRLALAQNPEVKAAHQAWEGAQARARQAGALPDPEFELEYEELPGFGDVGDFGERNIGVVQRIESPLKWWHRRKAGKQQAQATRLLALETTRQDVRLRVSVAFDRIVLHQNILQHTRKNLALARDILRKARIRLQAGDVPQLEVMRAEVEAGRATNQVTAAQNNLSAAQAVLNTLLARPLDALAGLEWFCEAGSNVGAFVENS